MKPTTAEILKYLTEVTKIDSESARGLSDMIKSQFERVMEAVENKPFLLDYLSCENTEEMRGQFCDRLMSILAPGKYKNSESHPDGGPEGKEDAQYEMLYNLGEEILHLQKDKKWWEGDMSYLSHKTILFFCELFEYCEGIDPEVDQDDTDDVKVYSLQGKKSSTEPDTYHDTYDDGIEDDDWEDYVDDDFEDETVPILKHEARVVAAVLQMVSAYFDSIDQRSRSKPIKSILLEEKMRGRWRSLIRIMGEISDVLEDDSICTELDKHDDFTTSMSNAMTRYTAFRINLD